MLILLVVALGGSESLPQSPSAPEDIAIDAAALLPFNKLQDNCHVDTREEKRGWFVSEHEPHYLLRFLGRTQEDGIRGNLLRFDDCRMDGGDANPRHSIRCDIVDIETDPANWTAAYMSVVKWDELDAETRLRGVEPSLTLYVESCFEGIYESRVVATGTDEAIAVTGLVLYLADIWTARPSN